MSAQNRSWTASNPETISRLDRVDKLLETAEYDAADKLLREAIYSKGLPAADQLLLLQTWAHELTMAAHFSEAIACLKYGQERFRLVLDSIPAALAQQIECYADIAIEVQVEKPRQSAVEKMEKAYRLLEENSPQRGVFARKIAVLCRITQQPEKAKSWFELAEQEANGNPVDHVRLLNEAVLRAKQDRDMATCLVQLTQSRAELDTCTHCLIEDRILNQALWADYYQNLSETASDPYEFRHMEMEELEIVEGLWNQHPEVISQPLLNSIRMLAILNQEDGEMNTAVALSKRTLDAQLKRKVAPLITCRAYTTLANNFHYLGRLQESLDYFSAALNTFTSNFSPKDDVKNYLTYLANYGQEFIQIGQYADGEPKMVEAIELLENSDPQNIDLAIFHSNLGQCYAGQNLHEEAVQQFQLAADQLLGKSRMGSYHVGAQSRINAAIQLLKLGQPKEADKQIQLGLAAIAQLPAKAPLSKVFPLLDLATYYSMTDDLEGALKTNHKLLQVVLFDFKSADLYECPDMQNYLTPWYTLEAVDQKMNILWRMYQKSGDLKLLEAMRACGQRALTLLRKLRQERNHEGDKLKVNEKWRKLYENSLRADMELFAKTKDRAYLETAFQTIEQSKAMMLIEAVVENLVLEQSSTTSSLAAERKELQGRMYLLRRQILNQNGTPSELLQKQQDLLQLQKRMDALLQEIETANPKYFELVYGVDVIQIPALQDTLRKQNSSLVEYFYGDSAIYTVVVSSDTLVVQEYHPDAAFEENLKAFMHNLHSEHAPEKDGSEAQLYATSSQMITDRLWKPIATLLGTGRVTVVPDGLLSFISFDALVDSVPPKAKLKFQNLRYFVERYTISYQYSATFLSAPDAATANEPLQILAMAPDFAGQKELRQLPASIIGVEGIGDCYENVKVYSGLEATKSAFLADQGRSGIIDLATHGKYDQKNFMDSRLHFAADGTGDSVLYLRELYTMSLPAELAILEACETGLGDYHQGEGVMSLARGFTYAGCQSVLMSLWEVTEEKDTPSRITQDFYNNLADGQPRDSAISNAKRANLAYMRENQGKHLLRIHPFFWSELVMIGKQGPIRLERRNAVSTYNLLWLLILLPIGYVGYRLWARRKKS